MRATDACPGTDDQARYEQTKLPAFLDVRLARVSHHSVCEWLATSSYSNGLAHWARSRAAALQAAHAVGLTVQQARLCPNELGLLIEKTLTGTASMTPFDAPGSSAGFEEEGGPGLKACFDFVDAHSSIPIVDVQMLLRWVLVSYVLGHTEQHAGHVELVQTDNEPAGSKTWRLAPFAWMTTFAGVACGSAYPLPKGMRLGLAWPHNHVMVHQLLCLAAAAQVKPKVVITMAQSIASTLPEAMRMALAGHYRASAISTASTLLRLVQLRAQRLLEVCTAAGAQGVPGVKKIALSSFAPMHQGSDDIEYAVKRARKFYPTAAFEDLEE